MISKAENLLKVQSILDEIGVGNVYQVNLTNSVVNAEPGDHESLYRQGQTIVNFGALRCGGRTAERSLTTSPGDFERELMERYDS